MKFKFVVVELIVFCSEYGEFKFELDDLKLFYEVIIEYGEVVED